MGALNAGSSTASEWEQHCLFAFSPFCLLLLSPSGLPLSQLAGLSMVHRCLPAGHIALAFTWLSRGCARFRRGKAPKAFIPQLGATRPQPLLARSPVGFGLGRGFKTRGNRTSCAHGRCGGWKSRPGGNGNKWGKPLARKGHTKSKRDNKSSNGTPGEATGPGDARDTALEKIKTANKQGKWRIPKTAKKGKSKPFGKHTERWQAKGELGSGSRLDVKTKSNNVN